MIAKGKAETVIDEGQASGGKSSLGAKCCACWKL